MLLAPEGRSIHSKKDVDGQRAPEGRHVGIMIWAEPLDFAQEPPLGFARGPLRIQENAASASLCHRAEPRCYRAGNDRCPSGVEGAVPGTE